MEQEILEREIRPGPPTPDEADRPVCDPERFAGEAAPARGSAALGILGAALGALVGAIPWFFVSTFTSFFVGWLGFLVGLGACSGYRRLRGLRSTRFAMVTVVATSLLALFAAEAASWMFVLCTDPDWQADAAAYGISVARLAWESLLMPENWAVIAPSLGLGMLIGILGVFSARNSVLQYTDPDRAAKGPAAAPAAAGVWGAPAATGLRLPERFVLRESRLVVVLGVICTALFGLLFVGGLLVLDLPGELGYVLIGLCLTLVGVWCILDGTLRRLEVDGDALRYVSSFGKVTEFSASDIAGVSMGQTVRLRGGDGQLLAKFEHNMKNSPLLMQYLAERNVPLQG